jgi:hypothetical protein
MDTTCGSAGRRDYPMSHQQLELELGPVHIPE